MKAIFEVRDFWNSKRAIFEFFRNDFLNKPFSIVIFGEKP
jgi:hypothetical protein